MPFFPEFVLVRVKPFPSPSQRLAPSSGIFQSPKTWAKTNYSPWTPQSPELCCGDGNGLIVKNSSSASAFTCWASSLNGFWWECFQRDTETDLGEGTYYKKVINTMDRQTEATAWHGLRREVLEPPWQKSAFKPFWGWVFTTRASSQALWFQAVGREVGGEQNEWPIPPLMLTHFRVERSWHPHSISVYVKVI